MRKVFFLLVCVLALCTACRREPSVYHSKVDKSSGDNGVKIVISENPKNYIPGKLYIINLMTSNPLDQGERFKKFILTAEAAEDPGNFSPQRVGNFQLFRDSLAKFNFECINTLKEVNDSAKSEVIFMWNAPPPGSGCVTFKAMILRDAQNWFADEGGLVKTICEQSEMDKVADPQDCCACDEATYSLIFEGIWSSQTHPKDYPTLLWLTHFSDVIGASHERNFSFWGKGQIASEGFRSLAEWGSVRLMETELRAKSKYLRTIIKAAGLWYPSVNSNTTAKFKVDRKHHLISLASMFGPTPDWVVGINGLNLCLKNCTWQENAIIDLYPYDAGTDSGITYMSPNAETVPRERIYRITTTYPEDPRAPFYDPSKTEIPPLARLYIKKTKVTPRNCDDDFLNAQVDVNENSEDTLKVECAVTEYSAWSNCSVSCGKGLRMRKRQYKLPDQAAASNCNRQLVSKEMCVAAIPECPKGDNKEDDLAIEAPLPEDTSGVCAVSEWENWSSCSVSCGIGFEMKTRHFLNKMGRKKCLHIPTVEKRKCMRPACVGGPVETVKDDSLCPTTEWSDWSPCSTSCGKGVRTRTRLLLVEPALQKNCSSRIKMMQHSPCQEVPDCTLNIEAAKIVCLQDYEAGECQGSFNRWYFDNRKFMCLPFIYQGCRGNKNNFVTLEDCHQSCGVIKDFANGRMSTAGSTTDDSLLTNGTSNRITLDHSINKTKVDCVMSEYSSWSPCSVTCGRGYSQSIRSVLTRPQNGGRVCPSKLLKKRRCSGPPCSKN